MNKYKRDESRYSKNKKGLSSGDIDPRLKVSKEALGKGFKRVSKETYKKVLQRKIYRSKKSVDTLLEQALSSQKNKQKNIYAKDLIDRLGLSKVYRKVDENYLSKLKNSDKRLYLQKFVDIRSGKYETYINKNYENNLLTAISESGDTEAKDIVEELIKKGKLDNETIRELSQNEDVQYLMSFYNSEDIDDSVYSLMEELQHKGLIVFNKEEERFEVRDLRKKYNEEEYDFYDEE